ncbi:MAG: hypothetical protein K5848_08310 [Lachnospiraceae bacterium]|nr:hypothetical protein [Lachnospiraceae bacterium]
MNFISTSRLRKMKKLFRAREYAAAVEYAAKLNPQEITTAYDLSMMADVYVINKDLESAKVIYQELYKRNKSSRNLKTLIDASIKCGDIEGAVVSLRELIAMDDTDIDIYIFQYRIGKITNQSDDYLIKCLQKVRELDYIDVWALALAKLYFKAGLNEECLKECKNIKLWFPETDFEHKAQLLEDAVSSGASYEDLFGNAPSEDMIQDVPHDADGYIPLEESDYENDGEDVSAGFAEGDEEPLPEIEFEDEEIPHVTLGDETLAAGGYDGTDYYDDDDDDDCDEFGNVIVKEPEEEKDDDEIDGQLSFDFDFEEEEEPVEEELPEEEPEDTKEYFDDDDFDDDDDDDDCDEFGNVIIRKPEPADENISGEVFDEEEEEIAEELFAEEEDDEEIEGGSIPDEYYDYDDDDDDDDCDEYGNVIIREPEEDEFTFDDKFSDELLEAVTREENGEASGEEVDESINRMLRGNKK